MFEQFTEYLRMMVMNFGSWAVFLTMTIESMGAPLPSEIIMPLAGFLVSIGQMEMWEAVAAGTLGCTAGSLLSYWVGRKWGDQAMHKVGRFLFISPSGMDRTIRWFTRYGQAVIFWARLLPVVRGLVSYPAGSTRLNLGLFLLLSTLGSLIWCWLFAWLGLLLGNNWEAIYQAMHGPILWVVIGLGVIFLAGLVWLILRRRRLMKEALLLSEVPPKTDLPFDP
jgi:membrane protein DedA with SNARE-associated domain